MPWPGTSWASPTTVPPKDAAHLKKGLSIVNLGVQAHTWLVVSVLSLVQTAVNAELAFFGAGHTIVHGIVGVRWTSRRAWNKSPDLAGVLDAISK